jgi:hypothetical protein
MLTIDQAVKRYGVQLDAEYVGGDPIPVLDGLQFQGDVAIVPATGTAKAVVPVEGVAVVRGENGGNTHLLLPSDGVTFDPADTTDESLTLGLLTVAKGKTAYLAHPQHGYAGIAPGSYELRRQREQADVIRQVQD